MTFNKVKLFFFVFLTTASFNTDVEGYHQREHVKRFPQALQSHDNAIPAEKHNSLMVPPRFMQSKSKFNLAVWLTNTMYPHQQIYKPQFQTGGCPGWYLNTAYGPPSIGQDFLQTNGWSYDLPNRIIQYQGYQEDREPAHPFPFFFLYRRTWTRSSLIKKNFFCQNTQITSDVQLNGAEEAGLIFRVLGDWNFWGFILNKNGKAQLLRIKDGEKIILQETHGLTVREGEWYSIQLNEMIGDIKVSVKDTNGKKDNVKWSLQEIDEIENEDQGAVGLLASKGPAKFRNTFFGEVSWIPNYGGPGKISQITNAGESASSQGSLAKDLGEIGLLKDKLSGWCPPGALCAGQPYYYATTSM